jgi:hypothetical protein
MQGLSHALATMVDTADRRRIAAALGERLWPE